MNNGWRTGIIFFAPLLSRVSRTSRSPRACPRSPEKCKKTGNFEQELPKPTDSRPTVDRQLTDSMGRHIIQKWYEFTINDQDNDRYD